MVENALTQQDVVAKLQSASWVMLTGARSDGKLLSHPMVPQRVNDEADVWFFVSLTGDQADILRQNAHVNIAVDETGSWLSVSGQAEFVDDAALVDELWNDQAAGWFEGGKTDPSLGLLKVSTDSAQFWGTPGGKVAALAQIVRSRLTGQHPSGTSDTTEL